MRRKILLASLFCLSTPAPAWDDPAWPAYQGNAAHSGFIDREITGSDFAIDWRVNIGSRAVSGFALGSGMVFATSVSSRDADTILIALSIGKGQELWRKTYLTASSVNPPAYDADTGTVLVQTVNHVDDSYLRAYAAVGGAVRWESSFLVQWSRYLAPTVVGGNVFVGGGEYGGAYAFDISDGTQNWFCELPFYDGLTPVPAGDEALLVFTNRLSVLNRDNGLPAYEIIDPGYAPNGRSVGQTPVVIGDMAYVTYDGFLVAYDLIARLVAWKLPISAYGQVSTDGSVLFVIAGSSLSARHPTDGAALWSVTSPTGGFAPQILVFRNHVVVGNDTTTYLIDSRTRSIQRSWPIGGLLAYGDHRLLIGDSRGAVTAIRLSSTALLTDGFE